MGLDLLALREGGLGRLDLRLDGRQVVLETVDLELQLVGLLVEFEELVVLLVLQVLDGRLERRDLVNELVRSRLEVLDRCYDLPDLVLTAGELPFEIIAPAFVSLQLRRPRPVSDRWTRRPRP